MAVGGPRAQGSSLHASLNLSERDAVEPLGDLIAAVHAPPAAAGAAAQQGCKGPCPAATSGAPDARPSRSAGGGGPGRTAAPCSPAGRARLSDGVWGTAGGGAAERHSAARMAAAHSPEAVSPRDTPSPEGRSGPAPATAGASCQQVLQATYILYSHHLHSIFTPPVFYILVTYIVYAHHLQSMFRSPTVCSRRCSSFLYWLVHIWGFRSPSLSRVPSKAFTDCAGRDSWQSHVVRY